MTVFIPVKDGMPYIETAVRSILDQTLSDLELIVVDDASTDGTAECLAALAKEDPRIRVITMESNVGPPAASNRALEIARGEFAARMDADDIAEPNRLEIEVAYLRAHPEVDIVGGGRRFIRPDGEVIRQSSKPEDPFQVAWLSRFRWPFVHPTILFRIDRGKGKEVPRYDPSNQAVEDYDFSARYLAESKGANLPDILISYRVHDKAMSGQLWARQQEMALHVAEPLQKAHYTAETFERLSAFREAYFLMKPQPLGAILAGFVAAIRHELPAASRYRDWMCREATVLYYLTARRTGHGLLSATVAALWHAPDLLWRAIRWELTKRMIKAY